MPWVFVRSVWRFALATHQFQPDAHSGGIGRPNCSSLTMRLTPRVNQDSLPRFRLAG